MQEKMPLVSVLMTAYNREKYIAEAIESVLASSYTNFELIIVDDRSTDNTVLIAKKFAAKDIRISVYINEQNLGDYPNRNKAASYATGKYIKYVDADDCIYPLGIEILISMMEKFPDAGWGICSLQQNIKSPFPFMLNPKEAYSYNYFGPGIFHKAPLSAIIKRQIFDEVGGFASIRMAGDFEMWHRLAQSYNVVLMPDGIVWYREHDEQEINHFRKFITVYEKIKIEYLNHKACPLDKDSVKFIFSSTKNKIAKAMLRAIFKMDKNTFLDNFSRLRQYNNAV